MLKSYVLWFFITLCVTLSFAIQPTLISANVSAAAQSGLPDFLQKIPTGQYADYGLHSSGELSELTLGTPFLLHTILPETMFAWQDKQGVTDLLSETALWYFPVQLDSKSVAMLVVEATGDTPARAVSFGYAPLAHQIEQAKTSVRWSDSPDLTLIAVYQAKEFFLACPSLHPDRIVTLQSKTPREDSTGEVIHRLIPTVKSNLAGGN